MAHCYEKFRSVLLTRRHLELLAREHGSYNYILSTSYGELTFKLSHNASSLPSALRKFFCYVPYLEEPTMDMWFASRTGSCYVMMTSPKIYPDTLHSSNPWTTGSHEGSKRHMECAYVSYSSQLTT